MGLFDLFELGAVLDPNSKYGKAFEELFPGSYSTVLGDALTAIGPGGQQAHIYGDSIQYTVDWEEILQNLLKHIPFFGHYIEGAMESVAGQLVTGLLMGTGGYVCTVFGRNTAMNYGPTTGIQRGPTQSITGKSWLFGTASPGGASAFDASSATAAQLGEQKKIDTIAEVGTTLLSLLMIGVGVLTDLYNAYYQAELSREQAAEGPDGPTDAQKEQEEKTKRVDNLFRLASWGATNRILAIILLIEKAAASLRDGIHRTPSVEEQLTRAEQRLTLNALTITAVKTELEGKIQASTDAAATALDDAIQGVTDRVTALEGDMDTLSTSVSDMQQADKGTQRTIGRIQQGLNDAQGELKYIEFMIDGITKFL